VSQHERETNTPAAANASVTAGALLRAAREQAGLSIDAVAQQLKLAPRQVKALEDDDFALLPGRTFVRGFARNYARLAKLDPDVVLAALPGGNADSGLAAPTLHSTAQSIGELPVTQGLRQSWARWAIPLTLVAIIAAAVAYELLRPPAPAPSAPSAAPSPSREPASEPKAAEAPAAPVAPGAPAGTATPAPVAATTSSGATPTPAAPPGTTVTALPNPVASATTAQEATASSTASPGATPAPATAAEILGPQPGDRELVLTYRDHSWTEVRDRSGRLLLSAMMTPGSRKALFGQAPFELVIGNASDVTLTLDGKTVDLVAHTRQSVARLTLQ
jgi:cytoskeleton protein RodZ